MGRFVCFPALLLNAAIAFAATPLIPGDPLASFMRIEGSLTVTTVPNAIGMPFTTSAVRIKTGAIPSTANAWDYRIRCFTTAAAAKDDTVLASFWVRAISGPDGKALTSFVLERNNSPYTKSINSIAVAGTDWKYYQIPFSMAETYTSNDYNFSLWVTYPNQEIEIGGLTVENYGNKVPFASLNLTDWPYPGFTDPNAPWRAAAAGRIDKYRKGDIVVVAHDDKGNPLPGAPVHIRMRKHAFGFGTAVAGDPIMSGTADGQRYRDALKKLFNMVVTENALKWPFYESWGRPQADMMLPWFQANGFDKVRGHNIIWPGKDNLPDDVDKMLEANPVDKDALRARIRAHITDVVTYARGKVTEWDVVNEPVTNKDVQTVLGDAEMASWFKQTRDLDPNVKLFLNDYSNVEGGGYDLQHINGTLKAVKTILDNGGPVDGIGLQAHFDSSLTPPDRVLEVLNMFAAFGKDLEITEFDMNIAGEQLQAAYMHDFMTVTFSHPSVKAFLMWGFWEGAHWLPRGAMIRLDWTTKPTYDVWNDLVFNKWWTNVDGITGTDGTFRTRGFLGQYEVEVNGRTMPLSVESNSRPAYVGTLNASGTITAAGIVNAASFVGGSVAPGEIVTIFGSGFGAPNLTLAYYSADGKLATSVGDTRVLFDGVPAPMIYSKNNQVSAIVPYAIRESTAVQVEYQGVLTNSVSVPVAAAAPGIFTCGANGRAVIVTYTANGTKTSCDADFEPPKPGDVITFFVTGQGVTNPAGVDGQLPAAPYPAPVQQLGIKIGGVPVDACAASFVGLVYAGVLQLNACVPANAAEGTDVPLEVSSGNVTAAAPMAVNWKMVWQDEFNGPAGTAPDPAKWKYDLGANGWGNAELENYTNSTDNVYQDGNGNLVIKAIKNGNTYTSGRIKTQDKNAFAYGRIEARIKIPYGQGIWPAFWMLGDNIGTAGWPAGGEIDIMENIGKEPSIVHGTVHGPGYSGGNGIGKAFSFADNRRFADDFHIYALQWDPNRIQWFVDGQKYFEVTPSSLPAGTRWVYDHPFFIILNLAVGGYWPGYPDSSTVFPQTMLVDWVRVSQKQ